VSVDDDTSEQTSGGPHKLPSVLRKTMNKTKMLRDVGQSIWLDGVAKIMLDDGTLKNYVERYDVTGLIFNPSIFKEGIRSGIYDNAIYQKSAVGKNQDDIVTELALSDLCRAADLFRSIYDVTDGKDGWVSMEISPLLAKDYQGSIVKAKAIHNQANRPNVFVKIPGVSEEISAIEELIYYGIPVNVTFLFSEKRYIAAAEAYLRGIERRIADGLEPMVRSVASVFISRWDELANEQLPMKWHNQLGIAVAANVYRQYLGIFNSERWAKLSAKGAKPQQLLWTSTAAKDPNASRTHYIEALAMPNVISAMSERTLKAYAEQGAPPKLSLEDTNNQELFECLISVGIDVNALALQLEVEGIYGAVRSWNDLLIDIALKSKSSTQHERALM
jgi:transaldolase